MLFMVKSLQITNIESKITNINSNFNSFMNLKNHSNLFIIYLYIYIATWIERVTFL